MNIKLISLTLAPDGNEHGHIMEVIIDHNIDVFKPCYVRVVRLKDGTHEVTDYPPNIPEVDLIKAVKHAEVIIDLVYDMTCGF